MIKSDVARMIEQIMVGSGRFRRLVGPDNVSLAQDLADKIVEGLGIEIAHSRHILHGEQETATAWSERRRVASQCVLRQLGAFIAENSIREEIFETEPGKEASPVGERNTVLTASVPVITRIPPKPGA